MLKLIAEEISLRLVTSKIISIDDRSYYIYGIEIVLENIFTFISLLILAVLTDSILITIVYVLVYCPIRSYVGGYHCKKFYQCYFTTLTLFVLLLYLNYNFSVYREFLSLIIITISTIAILIFAPISYTKVQIDRSVSKRYKAISKVLTMLAVIGYILSFALHFTEISFAISWGMFAVFILMLISLVGNLLGNEDKQYEK